MSQPSVRRFALLRPFLAALVVACAALGALVGCAVPGTSLAPQSPQPTSTRRAGSIHNGPPAEAVATDQEQRPVVRQQAPAPDDELLGMDLSWLRELSPTKTWARVRQKTPWRHDEETART